MSRLTYGTALDRLLAPEGFQRQGRDWIRIQDGFEDCVNLQVSQYAGTTANISTKDLATETLLDEALGPGGLTLKYPDTVRIGELMDGADHWWKRDPKGPAELSAAVTIHALPYFRARRSLLDQAYWFGRQGKRWGRYQLHLAATLFRLGEIAEAIEVASYAPPRWLGDGWKARAERFRHWLEQHQSSVAGKAADS
jgi:hypothetical protein